MHYTLYGHFKFYIIPMHFPVEYLLSVHQNTLCDRLVCPSVCLSVCPSVCSHDNSWTRGCRMMKLGTIILEVKSNFEFEDGSRTWPLTRSNRECVLVNTCIDVLLQFILHYARVRNSWFSSQIETDFFVSFQFISIIPSLHFIQFIHFWGTLVYCIHVLQQFIH